MKHILKVAIIFAIIFNCTILLLRTPGVPPQVLNTGYAKNADTNPL